MMVQTECICEKSWSIQFLLWISLYIAEWSEQST